VRLARFALAALALLVLAVGLRTARFGSRQVAAPPPDAVAVDSAAAIARLSAALRVRTVSREEGPAPDSVFAELHQLITDGFPRLNAALEREVVGGSLLYTWRGRDAGRPAVVLMGHLDVVPVEPGTEARWSYPPFDGAVADGFVWGRGALDDKGSVFAVLEAVEALLGEGFRPARTIVLAFGHDEEIGGTRGAARLVERLAARRQSVAWVLDEGGAVTRGLVPGVAAPVATVGVAEKGYASVEMSVVSAGGHSSTPPPHTAIGRLAAAVARLEEHPFPARVAGATRGLLDYAGPEMALPLRAVIANLWLLERPMLARFSADPVTAATVRTTTAVTIFRAGTKENVLPGEAHAVANFRILPGDSVASVVARVRQVVNDPAVQVRLLPDANEPSPVASPDSEGFRAVATAVRQTFPGTVVAPYLVIGATDARHYARLTPNALRFVPVPFTGADLERTHGTNERVAVGDYVRAIRFYAQLLRNAAR
jgi:carboxypeptidase PM20D1